MSKNLTPKIQVIWNNLSISDILNDNFVRNQFHERGLKIKDAGVVTLVFKESGKVHVHGHSSTESSCAEIAIMKNMIKDHILDDPRSWMNDE